MDRVLLVETVENYEQRVEEIEAERNRTCTMKRFERRIRELEAQIKPQIDEIRALKAGLNRLRREAEGDRAVKSGASNGCPHANKASSTAGQTDSEAARGCASRRTHRN